MIEHQISLHDASLVNNQTVAVSPISILKMIMISTDYIVSHSFKDI